MAIPVSKPPLEPGKGKAIYFSREELVRIDDALCSQLYVPDSDGALNPNLSPETRRVICHIVDKINRHI